MRVHVVGNACIDTTFGLARFPLPGETLNAGSVSEGVGGKGANQAVAATRAGARVTLWTALGRDAAGAWIRNAIAGENLDLQALALDVPSDRSTIVVDRSGENFIVSGVACAEAYDPAEQTGLLGRIEAGDLVVLQGNLTTSATEACLRAARKQGARTMLNMSPLRDTFPLDLASSDIVVVNRGEAQALAERSDLEQAAEILAGRGAATLIITVGAEGCLWRNANSASTHRLPAPAVSAIDTSGAGDVFCGCLAGALARGLDLAESLQFALAAASIAVTRPGTLASCPSSAEMAALFDRMKAKH